jgi:hypothetical protein
VYYTVEHLRVWGDGKSFQQTQLQDAFYAIYEPEVLTASFIFSEFKKDDVRYVKQIKKFSSSYLLDKMELNSKSRSVFCWTGAYSVFYYVYIDTMFILCIFFI